MSQLLHGSARTTAATRAAIHLPLGLYSYPSPDEGKRREPQAADAPVVADLLALLGRKPESDSSRRLDVFHDPEK